VRVRNHLHNGDGAGVLERGKSRAELPKHQLPIVVSRLLTCPREEGLKEGRFHLDLYGSEGGGGRKDYS